MPSGTRNKRATWCRTGTLCRERDWSRHRLIHELQNGLRYRTIPDGHTVDWTDPEVLRTLDVEAGAVTITDEQVAKERPYIGLGLVTLGIEIWDGEVSSPPSPAADAPALAPAPRRTPLTGKELRDCILAIQKERPDDPPSRDDLREEVENRLNWAVGRDRVESLRKKIAPQWVKPKGRPRKIRAIKNR